MPSIDQRIEGLDQELNVSLHGKVSPCPRWRDPRPLDALAPVSTAFSSDLGQAPAPTSPQMAAAPASAQRAAWPRRLPAPERCARALLAGVRAVENSPTSQTSVVLHKKIIQTGYGHEPHRRPRSRAPPDGLPHSLSCEPVRKHAAVPLPRTSAISDGSSSSLHEALGGGG